MIRTEPDRAFAAAARSELQRRVRASAAREDRPRAVSPERRRPWLLQAVGGAAAVLLVAAIAVGLQHIAPTRPPSPLPAATATAASTATTSPAPTAADPSASAATPVPVAPLLGVTGARLRSDAELRAFARDHSAASVDPVVVGDQDVILVHCMVGKGWLYDPIRQRELGLTAHPGLTDAQWTAFQTAFSGPATTGAYDWRTAGCDGLAVHETGQDGNH